MLHYSEKDHNGLVSFYSPTNDREQQLIKEGGHFKLMPVVPFVLVQIIIHPARPGMPTSITTSIYEYQLWSWGTIQTWRHAKMLGGKASGPVAYRCIVPMPLPRHWNNASVRHRHLAFCRLSFAHTCIEASHVAGTHRSNRRQMWGFFRFFTKSTIMTSFENKNIELTFLKSFNPIERGLNFRKLNVLF